MFEGEGIRLDVCGVDEAFEWAAEDVDASCDEIIAFFTTLFTSYVLMETCGAANWKSRMNLFNKHGDQVGKYALSGFIQHFSGWDCDKHLFFPMYDEPSSVSPVKYAPPTT